MIGVQLRQIRMNPEEQNKVLDAWQNSARYWDKYRALITQMFAPLTSGLVEEARIGPAIRCLISVAEAANHRSPSQALLGQQDQ